MQICLLSIFSLLKSLFILVDLALGIQKEIRMNCWKYRCSYLKVLFTVYHFCFALHCSTLRETMESRNLDVDIAKVAKGPEVHLS